MKDIQLSLEFTMSMDEGMNTELRPRFKELCAELETSLRTQNDLGIGFNITKGKAEIRTETGRIQQSFGTNIHKKFSKLIVESEGDISKA